MKISTEGPPLAGMPFRLRVSETDAEVRVVVKVGRIRLRDLHCPDPPCHDLISIPKGVIGKVLSIKAINMEGTKATKHILIRGGVHSGGQTVRRSRTKR